MKFLRWDSPLMQKVALVGNLVILNILWVVCSLPIVTAGAATAAMYYTVFQFQTAEETEVIRPFFRGFRSNFKQATLLWIPTLVVGAILVLAVLYYIVMYPANTVLQAVVILSCAIFLMMQTQLLPMVARFDVKTGDALKNSLLLSLLHFPSSILMAVLNILPAVILYALDLNDFMRWLPLWVGLWFSLIAYLNGRMLLRIWKKRMVAEETPEPEKEEEAVTE